MAAAPARYPRPTPQANDDPTEYRFNPGQFGLLAVHDNLRLRCDQEAFVRLHGLAERIARNQLARHGLGRDLPGDPQDAAQDVVQQLCMNLREAEAGARRAFATDCMRLPDLLGRIEGLTGATGRPPESPVGPGEEPEPFCAGSPGAHLLAAMKNLSSRLLDTTPDTFRAQAQPWTSMRISAVVTAARQRLNAYTLTALKHQCRTALRAASKHSCESFDESHELPAHEHLQRGSSVVMSPHMRMLVISACQDGLAELRSSRRRGDESNIPFVEALIRVLPMLLDVPDEKPFALARSLLEQQELRTDQEIHRGLTAAVRHPVYQRVRARIQRGVPWH
jgi:hypothetical protein